MADLARAARDFSRILVFWAPETQNFRWPAGACAQSGVPALQVLEYLLGLIGYSKYWINPWHLFGEPYLEMRKVEGLNFSPRSWY